MRRLGNTQAMVLNYIEDYFIRENRCPTVREIQPAVQVRSLSTVSSAIRSLVQRGYLREAPAKPYRKIVPVRVLTQPRYCPYCGSVHAYEIDAGVTCDTCGKEYRVCRQEDNGGV